MDFTYGRTMKLLLRTLPFLVFRLLVYVGIALGWIIITAVGAGIGAMVGAVGGSTAAGATVGGLMAFVACLGILAFLRRYLLYMVKSAHIAVLVEAIDGRALPAGQGQVAYGQQAVKQRFVEMSVLFGVDSVIKGILRAFNRLVVRVANFLPIPGAAKVAKIGNAVINSSLTYVDETILGHNLRVRSTNPWETSRQGLILYAQNYSQFLKNAVKLTLGVWGLTLLIFLVLLMPVALVVWLLPVTGGLVPLLLTLSLTWAVKLAVVEPFAVTAMLQVWAKVTEGQVPNPEWEGKLQQASRKFGEMGAKARSWEHRKHDDDAPQAAGGTL
ncbi:hypothetical protein [Nesterenkonia muleiensis]|uniref:hypothetical protein n=1 Tax=Nesterenkonia muleiensis TaxID=2282648 RepID=UPI000E75F28F|nr:hypothetical protein [Nesterenkonia muleiensis]